jgi:hypothetical protein
LGVAFFAFQFRRALLYAAMILRILLLAAVLFAGVSCKSPLGKKKEKKTKPPPSMSDVSQDVSFQSFVGLLRKAVARHDLEMVASLMTPDFGYLMEPAGDDPGAGEGVFKHWEKNGIWPELQLIVNEKFVPFGNYMVAPQQFATDPNYNGYRAGIVNQNGSWKFAYFVNGSQAQ